MKFSSKHSTVASLPGFDHIDLVLVSATFLCPGAALTGST